MFDAKHMSRLLNDKCTIHSYHTFLYLHTYTYEIMTVYICVYTSSMIESRLNHEGCDVIIGLFSRAKPNV